MKYHNAKLRRKETEVEDSTDLLVSSRNQSATRQTRMDWFFGAVANESEEEDSDDDDEGTTIDNTDYPDKE
jgi:hypothetical protein